MSNHILTKWLICRADIHDGAYCPWFAIPPGTVMPEDPNEEQPIGTSFRTQTEAMQHIYTERYGASGGAVALLICRCGRIVTMPLHDPAYADDFDLDLPEGWRVSFSPETFVECPSHLHRWWEGKPVDDAADAAWGKPLIDASPTHRAVFWTE